MILISRMIVFFIYSLDTHYPNSVFSISLLLSDLELPGIPVQMKKCDVPDARE